MPAAIRTTIAALIITITSAIRVKLALANIMTLTAGKPALNRNKQENNKSNNRKNCEKGKCFVHNNRNENHYLTISHTR